MNDFVRRFYERVEDKSRPYEPIEPIEIECDLDNGSSQFHRDCTFKVGLVCLGGVVYNEYASDQCARMSRLNHRFRINGKVYDLRGYRDKNKVYDAFIAMIEEHITPQEVIDVEDIIL